MTREERAIQILEQRACCRECVVGNCTCAECDEAFDMAIKTLEQEPCEDAISRQAVLDLLEDTNNGWIINEVSQLPPVKPQEPTGHWIYNEDWDVSICSECGDDFLDDIKGVFNFCPKCGAKMD